MIADLVWLWHHGVRCVRILHVFEEVCKQESTKADFAFSIIDDAEEFVQDCEIVSSGSTELGG